VTVPATPATTKLPVLMLAGSIGVLKTTATARLVATPLVWGTIINIVGAAETSGAGGVDKPLQPMRTLTSRREVATLKN
jgi:hypothetical protein